MGRLDWSFVELLAVYQVTANQKRAQTWTRLDLDLELDPGFTDGTKTGVGGTPHTHAPPIPFDAVAPPRQPRASGTGERFACIHPSSI